MALELLKGNVAMAEAAIRAGVEAYFGYPITPQTELLEWMAQRMPELGRVFLQAESELAAINMVYGAACTGARVMTSSSSPGISLMMEGISYIAGTELPVVIIDVMRGGPGLGNIAPSQGDYNQLVHGGGHGDYHNIVLAPASVQEAIDLTMLAFDLAEKYRSVVIILADGNVGQMMEPAELPPMRPLDHPEPDWAVSGSSGRDRRILTSIYMNPEEEEAINMRLLQRWDEIERNEARWEEYFLEDAEIAVVGFGTAGRISLSAIRTAREQGLRVGLLRPVTVSPFPYDRIKKLSESVKAILVVEMNTGQMLGDVHLAAAGTAPVMFYGRPGGVVPYPEEIMAEITRIAAQVRDAGAGGRLPIDDNPRMSWMRRVQENGT